MKKKKAIEIYDNKHKCCVCTAKNIYWTKQVSTHNCELFKFPDDIKQRSIWLHNMNLGTANLTKNSRICSCHFRDGYFSTLARVQMKLVPRAVPTLYPRSFDSVVCNLLFQFIFYVNLLIFKILSQAPVTRKIRKPRKNPTTFGGFCLNQFIPPSFELQRLKASQDIMEPFLNIKSEIKEEPSDQQTLTIGREFQIKAEPLDVKDELIHHEEDPLASTTSRLSEETTQESQPQSSCFSKNILCIVCLDTFTSKITFDMHKKMFHKTYHNLKPHFKMK